LEEAVKDSLERKGTSRLGTGPNPKSTYALWRFDG
jgi:hypothetical protein